MQAASLSGFSREEWENQYWQYLANPGLFHPGREVVLECLKIRSSVGGSLQGSSTDNICPEMEIVRDKEGRKVRDHKGNSVLRPSWQVMPGGAWKSHTEEQVEIPKELEVVWYEGGELMEVRGPREACLNTPPTKAGPISGVFGRESRRRMMRVVGKLDRSVIGKPVFVTLTFHEDWPHHGKELHALFTAMFKRIEREWSEAVTLWRLEYQERGAPHLHMMIWRGPRMIRKKGANQELFKWFSDSWNEVVGHEVAAGTRVEHVKSQRGAWFYLASYCGKESDQALIPQDMIEPGRPWGIRGLKKGLITKHSVKLHVAQWQVLRDRVRALTLKGNAFTDASPHRQWQGVTAFVPASEAEEMIRWAGSLGLTLTDDGVFVVSDCPF